MSVCRYCGAAFTGEPTKTPCPNCGQKVPVKSMINAGFASLQPVRQELIRPVGTTAQSAVSSPARVFQAAPTRTPAQIKQEFHSRLAAQQKPKLFSPLRFLAALMLTPFWFALIFPIAKSYSDPMGHLPKFGLMGGIIPGVAALFYSRVAGRGAVRSTMATFVYAITALLVVAKPYIAPMKWQYENTQYSFSPTSETHLYFLIPGFILCFLTLLRFKTIFSDFAAMFHTET
jgi:hypothetical protein